MDRTKDYARLLPRTTVYLRRDRVGAGQLTTRRIHRVESHGRKMKNGSHLPKLEQVWLYRLVDPGFS